MSEINKIMIENYQRMRSTILRELQEDFYNRLQRKPNWNQEEIKEIFEESKDRV